MDRFLFRGKRLDNGEWVKGNFYESKLSGCFILVPKIKIRKKDGLVIGDNFEVYEVDPNTVCQCIGWYDSHKTPIFEKDIVEFVGASTHRDLIWWCNEMSEMTAIPLEGIEFNGYDYWNGNYPKYTYSDFCFMMQDPWGDFNEIKVVGNIVDNPELLEVQNEA